MDSNIQQPVETRIVDMEKAIKVGQFLIALILFVCGGIGIYVANQVSVAKIEVRVQVLENGQKETKEDFLRYIKEIKDDIKELKKQADERH